MSILQKIRQDTELKSYWQSLLGEKELEGILENEKEYAAFLEKDFSLDREEFQKFLEVSTVQQIVDGLEEEGWTFAPFYKRVCCYVQQKLDKVFQTKHLISVTTEVIQSLARQYVKGIQEIPLRCLLKEMEELKEDNKLLGEDESQEYKFFLSEYLVRTEYWKKLAAKYPVMMKLILQKAESYVSGLEELLNYLEQEKSTIESCLCEGRKISEILRMETSLSDEHIPGKTVTKIVFDNGTTVYYKPRGLKQEQQYERLYHWVCSGNGLENYNRAILDCGTHGWEREVAVKECREEIEVERYYERIGIHLCLTYLFGVSDIHFENIVACGEYPVLIDMELFPGYRKSQKGVLADSVLSSGILPGQTWGNAGVNASALGSIKEQKSPFKVPVLRNRNTSNMHISYDYAKVNCADCVPELDRKKVQADRFIYAVENGFDEAYEYIFLHREEIIEAVSVAEVWKSRYVMSHTQQYRMYQTIVTFPEFMADFEARRLLLLRMNREKLCFYEAETIMQGMTPIYYIEGRNLELGDGTVIQDYFEEDVWAQAIERLRRMGKKDKYHQQKLIALSMSAEKPHCREVRKEITEEGLTAHRIVEQIQLDTEQLGEERQWIILEHGKEGRWQFQNMGMYLYDGIVGIAIFLMAYGSVYGTEQQEELRERVIRKLFSYTDRVMKDYEELQSRHTGIMNGESSIVYTYLILYSISGEERFLEYAKKHVEILENLIEEDRKFDILEGNAGAVIVMVHLFQITGDEVYREIARQAADMLFKHAVQMEEGIGWILPGQSYPLAGLAHGNSGIMLAFARLYSITGEEKYHEVVERARKYEDSIYDTKLKNWRDMRVGHRKPTSQEAAWCHGASGILIAMTQIDKIMGIDMARDWRLKIAEENVRKTKKRECCLCHGKVGNAASLRYTRGEEMCNEVKWEELTYYEKYQMGFMTGLAGIGYEMLKKEAPQLPEVLALEV